MQSGQLKELVLTRKAGGSNGGTGTLPTWAGGSERTEREQLPQHSGEMAGPLNTCLVHLEKLDLGKGASILDKDFLVHLLRTIEPEPCLCPLCAATTFGSNHKDQRLKGLSCKTLPV